MKIREENGDILDVQCQQYLTGLYVCIYKNGQMLDQFGLDIPKEKFISAVKNNEVFSGVYIEA